MRRRTVWPWALALGAIACGPDPIVGGACRTGLTECNLKCVDLISDSNHCGTCDTVCSSDRTCFSGRCLTPEEIDQLDSGRRDGGVAGAEHSDGGDDDASVVGDASDDGSFEGGAGDASTQPDVSVGGGGGSSGGGGLLDSGAGGGGYLGGGGSPPEAGAGGDGSAAAGGAAGRGGSSGEGGFLASGGSLGAGGAMASGGSAGEGGIAASGGQGGVAGDAGPTGEGGSLASGGSSETDAAAGGGGAVEDGAAGNDAPDDAFPLDGADEADSPNPCVPPYNTPTYCGNCETSCSGDKPLCTLTDGGYACSPVCTPPEILCAGRCLDPMGSDEANCGSCGNVCASLLCQVGKCVGRKVGHQIVIGMDYADPSTNAQSAQMQILADAVALPKHSPVRVVAFTQWADPAIAARVPGDMAAATERTLSVKNEPAWSAVQSELDVSSYDVLLVYDQPRATTADLETAGTAWYHALDAFVKGGGVVIALDGGHTLPLLVNGGLVPNDTIEVDLTSQQLVVVSPSDAVAVSVTSPLAATQATVGFRTNQIPSQSYPYSTVVTDLESSTFPVVLHAVK